MSCFHSQNSVASALVNHPLRAHRCVRGSARRVLVTVVLCLSQPVLAQSPQVSRAELYLLAGTPTEHSPGAAFPVRLYTVDPEKKLRFVREVIPPSEGMRSAYEWGDEIFVIHPSIVSTTVSIIHAGAPKLVDDVEFNQDRLFLDDSAIAVAEPEPSSTRLLIPLLQDASDPKHLRGHLIVISAHASPAAPRITQDQWEEYSALRSEGAPGGPAIFPALIGSKADGVLAMSIYGHSIPVDDLPPPFRDGPGEIVPVFVVAGREYVVIARQRTRAEMDSPGLPDFIEEFVRARLLKQWKTIRIEGNSSSSRLFEPWLTTTVTYWNAQHKVSPGRESEHEKGDRTLPSVREGYATFRGRWNWSPGVLTLQSLADGRKIRIETGQEDSEVLRVENDVVLYRVNDSIFQARIVGSELKDTTLIVKDEDVPEIHWAFWSKAAN